MLCDVDLKLRSRYYSHQRNLRLKGNLIGRLGHKSDLNFSLTVKGYGSWPNRLSALCSIINIVTPSVICFHDVGP